MAGPGRSRRHRSADRIRTSTSQMRSPSLWPVRLREDTDVFMEEQPRGLVNRPRLPPPSGLTR
eukprot:3034859-Alexandrium_andersonii.AAC.1